MTTELLLSLLGLALVDSLSAGTLLIPIFFLLAPGRIRLGRILTYLATIASFYFLVGLILTAGASVFLENAAAVLETPAAYAVQLVLGAGLLAVAILMPTKNKVPVGAEVTQGGQVAQGGQDRQVTQGGQDGQIAQGGQDGQVTQGGQDGQIAQGGQDGEVAQGAQGSVTQDTQGPSADLAPARGRLARWRERALGSGSPATVIVLALAAGLIELATMIPYLAAVGLLTGAGLGFGGSALLLAVYCVVMIVPALLLLFARVAARRTVEPPLRRLADWLSRNAAENTAWIIGIVGFLLLRDALSHSASFDFWPFNT